MLNFLILLALALRATCQLYHIADVGPYDELSAEELDNAYRNLGTYLGREFISTHYFLPKHMMTSILRFDSLTRVVHAVLEVPAKKDRQNALFPRFARIALYTPKEPLITEYIVGTRQNIVNVTEVRTIPSIKRPVDEMESDHLQNFLYKVCSGEFGKFLKQFYGAGFLYASSSASESAECMKDEKSTENPASYPACLFGMYASPRVTMKKPSRRVTTFRLNRFIPPYNQHPIDVHITVS